MKTYRGTGRIPPYILSLGARCEWPASRPGRFTTDGKNHRHPWDRRLGGPQSRSGLDVEEKYLSSWRESNPTCPACSHSLYRLSYPGSLILLPQKIQFKVLKYSLNNWKLAAVSLAAILPAAH